MRPVGYPVEPDEAYVGVGSFGQSRQEARQHLRQGARRRACACHLLLYYARRLFRVFEAQRLQLLCRIQPRLVRMRHELFQRGAQEQLLLDAAHGGEIAVVLLVKGFHCGLAAFVSVAEHPRQPVAAFFVGWYFIHRPFVSQLHAMLHCAQIAVGDAQMVGVIGVYAACAFELLQGQQSVGRANQRIGATSHQHQQLRAELYVADSAGAALEISALALGDRLFHFGFEVADVVDFFRIQVGLPHEFSRRVQQLVGYLHVADHIPCFHPSLPLPWVCPLGEVVAMSFGRAAERAGWPFRAKVGIHGKQQSAGCGSGHLRHDLPGYLSGSTGGVRASVGSRRMDEHHIHIAGIVELVAAELAHADNGHADIGMSLAGLLKAVDETSIRQSRYLTSDRHQIGSAFNVAHHYSQHLAALPMANVCVGFAGELFAQIFQQVFAGELAFQHARRSQRLQQRRITAHSLGERPRHIRKPHHSPAENPPLCYVFPNLGMILRQPNQSPLRLLRKSRSLNHPHNRRVFPQ